MAGTRKRNNINKTPDSGDEKLNNKRKLSDSSPLPIESSTTKKSNRAKTPTKKILESGIALSLPQTVHLTTAEQRQKAIEWAKEVLPNSSSSTIWEKDADVFTLSGHTGLVGSVCISNDGNTIVSGSNDNTIKIWSIKDETDVKTLSDHTSYVYSVCISNDGSTIVSGSDDQTIRIWGIDGTLIRTLSGHTNSVRSVCILSLIHI